MSCKYKGSAYALAFSLSFALLALWSATGAKARAQTQDRLHEKLDFLKTNLETYLSHSVEAEGVDLGNIRFEAVSFETCKVTWKTSVEYGHSSDVPIAFRGLTIVSHVSVNLSTIDASRTKIHVSEVMKRLKGPWSLELLLSTRAGSPGFAQQAVSTKPGQVKQTIALREREQAFYFNVRDQQIAEEVSRAFADASAICRSRSSR